MPQKHLTSIPINPLLSNIIRWPDLDFGGQKKWGIVRNTAISKNKTDYPISLTQSELILWEIEDICLFGPTFSRENKSQHICPVYIYARDNQLTFYTLKEGWLDGRSLGRVGLLNQLRWRQIRWTQQPVKPFSEKENTWKDNMGGVVCQLYVRNMLTTLSTIGQVN